MPEHLKALVVILAAGTAIFWAAERLFCPSLVAPQDFRRRRNAWFAITLVAFLSHSFWLYAFLTATITYLVGRRDPNPLALYFTLLFAVPWLPMQLPAFGLINYIFTVNHFKILNLALLVPLALHLATGEERPRVVKVTDLLMLAYLAYTLTMSLPMMNATGVMRWTFDLFVEVWLPYFVVTRALRNLAQWREVIAAFVVAVAVLALLAPFEAIRSWLLFETLRAPLGTGPASLSTYLMRGDLLRSMGSFEHSIVLGYAVMVALLLSLFIARAIERRPHQLAMVALLVAGLLASFSRGPWVGAVIGLAACLALAPNPGRSLMVAGAVAVTAFAAALMLPGGDKLLAYLPFIEGGVDDGSLAYRTQLFNVSMQVFWNSPVFGSLSYMGNTSMEELRQGQGIIDMVNSYLGVAMSYGAVGLTLFCMPFIYPLWACRHVVTHAATLGPEERMLGAALVGAVVAAMATISAVSSIGAVPAIYWMLVGMMVAFAAMTSPSPMPWSSMKPKQATNVHHQQSSLRR